MTIEVVGLGVDADSLPEDHNDVVESAQVLVGGKRQLALFDDHPAEKVLITAPLGDIFERIGQYEAKGRSVVVLADGDPLFYGIGATLVDEFGPEGVHILPNITSLQAAAARAKVPWQGVKVVSLHGRDDMRPLMQALLQSPWVCVLTDGKSIPSSIAQWLLDRGADWFFVWVFENMGQSNEHFDRYTLKEAVQRSFSSLNTVLIERRGGPERILAPGIPDEELATEGKLITKWPVRAAGLAALRISHGMTVWDLGAGSGAVGIEASCLAGEGVVWCVERKASRVEHIRTNRRRFGALQVEVMHGTMPACLTDLPDPDRVFIGGGLGNGDKVLREACARLKPGGRIVTHCVLLGSLNRARELFAEMGWTCEITHVQASAAVPLAGDLRFDAHNPVFILAAQRPE
ncbi:precorrin-6y C5,15-methyltransferase (decarboxylating) subunit CbiE [Oleidesulfovibrio sp.]|uniref:precorrin-6y C5,15-methyltransferase (decarboxylating) subunit CbiE n=1 Tax=Oleidesulfovibrio sp. TaxID=2909707 RepID=UPI003A8674AB